MISFFSYSAIISTALLLSACSGPSNNEINECLQNNFSATMVASFHGVEKAKEFCGCYIDAVSGNDSKSVIDQFADLSGVNVDAVETCERKMGL